MSDIWTAARKDAMAPIERAFVFGALMALIAFAVTMLATEPGEEPRHWYEVVFAFAMAFGAGLVSDRALGIGILVSSAAPCWPPTCFCST